MTPVSPVKTSVLGVLSEGHRSPKSIIATVKQLGGTSWQPTGEAVLGAIEWALDAGYVRHSELAAHLEITGPGLDRFRRFLTVPWDGSNTAPGCVLVALKIRFLHTLTPDVARAVLTDLCRTHGQAIANLRARCSHAEGDDFRGSQWIRHEIERHDWELKWLQSLPLPRRACARDGVAIDLAIEGAR